MAEYCRGANDLAAKSTNNLFIELHSKDSYVLAYVNNYLNFALFKSPYFVVAPVVSARNKRRIEIGLKITAFLRLFT